MKTITALCFILIFLFACNTTTNEVKVVDTNTYIVPEDSAIAEAVKDAYRAISFEHDSVPSKPSIAARFIPQATLINFRSDTMQTTGIDDFIDFYEGFVKSSQIHLFYEEELYGKTERFGNIAHRISTYITYINTKDSASERGVNSFQLIKTPAGWKVSSIIWDVEKPDLRIPDYYLPAK
ncbi:hypothetical protein [Limnovirga soli]|uniref:Nuclear transport factor 2 family protein n=1 Tax=Limnovirga soli TaxID=2656915 RepID=A0A8J8FAE3_9BACT|nr:hypothetical protein [Limnovirga soli]NNV54435.1 hypothetical protein [Limnovirga soli]